MAGYLQGFTFIWKHKARIGPIKGRIGPVYGTVVIRTDEYHIVELVVAATTQPMYMMRFTEIPLV